MPLYTRYRHLSCHSDHFCQIVMIIRPFKGDYMSLKSHMDRVIWNAYWFVKDWFVFAPRGKSWDRFFRRRALESSRGESDLPGNRTPPQNCSTSVQRSDASGPRSIVSPELAALATQRSRWETKSLPHSSRAIGLLREPPRRFILSDLCIRIYVPNRWGYFFSPLTSRREKEIMKEGTREKEIREEREFSTEKAMANLIWAPLQGCPLRTSRRKPRPLRRS